MASNPFHDLYLSEAISEDDLVQFFSPIIVDHSGIVFEQGNVIIRGLQGTGKTMLLNLLRPELRLAYYRSGVPFPVPARASRYIGAGINLRKCGILEFAQHLDEGITTKQLQELSLLFADFFNYWVVADLIATIQLFHKSEQNELLSEIGLKCTETNLNNFAVKIANDPCWFGALDGTENLDQLVTRIDNRISVYRRYLNLNLDELPISVLETKTVVGNPILKAVEALRITGVIEEKTKVFVRIDQYEQLTTLNVAGTKYGSICQQLIHKALSARDGRVSYRIGTRTYGWDERPAIYRTDDVLEMKRDFDIHDMDELFRRRENRSTWQFPKFAEDIFFRRIRASEYANQVTAMHMNTVLGRSMPSSDRAEAYVSNPGSRIKLINIAIENLPSNTPQEWTSYIKDLATEDVLSAWLACAWVRQKIVPKKNSPSFGAAPSKGKFPWDSKPYWHKERVQLGLMQLASANRQTLMWGGEGDIVGLSDGQILLFLFLLQHIWDAWLRARRSELDDDFRFPITLQVQNQGVREASNEWRSKQTEGPNAYRRKSFVDALGEYLYVSLTNDKAMSNPGANGFSVENGDLESNPDIKEFLMDAVSYGDLVEAPHTSKKKGERRTKYYLAPILSPYFRIPSVHTKEPMYVTVQDVRKWLGEKNESPALQDAALEAKPILNAKQTQPSNDAPEQPSNGAQKQSSLWGDEEI